MITLLNHSKRNPEKVLSSSLSGQVRKSLRLARSGPRQAKCESCLQKGQAGIQDFSEP